MTIFCIGRNYIDHAKELDNPVPERPLVFCKPESALLTDNLPFRYPDFSDDVHYETELVLRIGTPGNRISEEKAWSHIDAITLGVDFTARDIQARCKRKGHPWEIAKGFDGSAPVGSFQDLPQNVENEAIAFSAFLNGKHVQEGASSDMIFPIPTLISYLSRFFTLGRGDLLFTGTPAGVGPVSKGDRIEGYLHQKRGKQKLLDFEIL